MNKAIKKSDIPLIFNGNKDGSNLAAAFERLALNLKYSFKKGGNNRLIFAAVDDTPDSGQICANTAASLAQTGGKVLVVDADFGGSALTRQVIPNGVTCGLADVLCGYCQPKDAVNVLPGKFDYIGIGHYSPNPAKLLTHDNIKTFFAEISPGYDWILISVAPITVRADAMAFCGVSDGVVLVAKERSSKVKNITAAAERVRYAGGNITGIVLSNSLSGLQGIMPGGGE